MKRIRTGVVTSLGAVALVWAATAGAAASDAEKCQASKNKEVGKYVACLQKAEAKAILKGTAPDYSKCDDTLHTKWAKLDSKYLSECPTIGDEESLQVASESFTEEVANLLGGAPPCLGNGVEVGGHCWFLGYQGESCQSVCVSEGLVYSEATREFAGSDTHWEGTCGSVLSALGVPSGPVFVSSSLDTGCAFCSVQGPCGSAHRRRYTGSTTSTGASALSRRACACEQP